ncbi:hypothetical protein V6N12_024152 [Hibiscus sabdariffa]|uniref:Uncharacterized protein n=1 Tax=Hibiscus sabdariffa TaxID=183260 RepID=A0ABR2FZQ6_9ROSI
MPNRSSATSDQDSHSIEKPSWVLNSRVACCTEGVGAPQALKQSSGCSSSELQLIPEIDKLRQLLAANECLKPTVTGHGSADQAEPVQEESFNDNNVVGSNEAQEEVLTDLTASAHVEADTPADVLESAEGGLEDIPADVLESAEGGLEDTPADVLESAEGGLEDTPADVLESVE